MNLRKYIFNVFYLHFNSFLHLKLFKIKIVMDADLKEFQQIIILFFNITFSSSLYNFVRDILFYYKKQRS